MSDTCVRYKCKSTCFSFARFLLTRVGLALHVPPQDLRELHQAVFAFPSNYTITWQKIAMNMICKNYEHKIRAKNSNVPKKTKQNAHFFVFRSISNFSWVECCWADSSLTRNELASLSAFSSWLILACASASAARVVSSWPLFSDALEKHTITRASSSDNSSSSGCSNRISAGLFDATCPGSRAPSRRRSRWIYCSSIRRHRAAHTRLNTPYRTRCDTPDSCLSCNCSRRSARW